MKSEYFKSLSLYLNFRKPCTMYVLLSNSLLSIYWVFDSRFSAELQSQIRDGPLLSRSLQTNKGNRKKNGLLIYGWTMMEICTGCYGNPKESNCPVLGRQKVLPYASDIWVILKDTQESENGPQLPILRNWIDVGGTNENRKCVSKIKKERSWI